MEANRGGGKLRCRGFPTTRSLREAWPEGAYDGAKRPQGAVAASSSTESTARRLRYRSWAALSSVRT